MFYHWEVSPGPLSRCPGCVVTCECQVTSGLAPGRDGDGPHLLHLHLHLAPADYERYHGSPSLQSRIQFICRNPIHDDIAR